MWLARVYLIAYFFPLQMTYTVRAQWVQTRGEDGSDVLAFAASGSNLIAGTSRGVYYSTNDGLSWTLANGPGYNNFPLIALVANKTDVFAGGDGGVFLSSDNGVSWTAVGNLFAGCCAIVTCLAAKDTNLFAGTFDRGLHLSTNNGTSWTEIGNLVDLLITSLTFSGSTLFVGTEGGVFRSNDNGWAGADSGIPHPDSLVWVALAASDTNLFAGIHSGGVFLSTNNGTSWSAVNTGLPSTASVWHLAVSGTNVFAGTDSGVFLSTNNGASWAAVNAGLINTSIRSLHVHAGYLFAGTFGGSIWRRPLSELITTVKQITGNPLPEKYALDQNYPNPFNPSTTITFELPSKSLVSLKLFDALGREVGRLVSEELPAGTYARQWNATGLPSGVYFYQLQAGSFIDTKKLLLLR